MGRKKNVDSTTLYIGAHRGLVREDRENFSLQQGIVAPFALSFSLLVGVVQVLNPSVDPWL